VSVKWYCIALFVSQLDHAIYRKDLRLKRNNGKCENVFVKCTGKSFLKV